MAVTPEEGLNSLPVQALRNISDLRVRLSFVRRQIKDQRY